MNSLEGDERKRIKSRRNPNHAIFSKEYIQIRTEYDIVEARQRVKARAIQLGFRFIDQVRLMTATSELTRNIYDYAYEGIVTIEKIKKQGKTGIQITFEDLGPGISDIDRALEDGFSTGGGMGKGLPGTKRLVDNFQIESKVNEGTKVIITKWL